jgi:hypothetical protein
MKASKNKGFEKTGHLTNKNVQYMYSIRFKEIVT